MSVKYFDKNKNKWVIFPGTVGAPGKNGKDAYDILYTTLSQTTTKRLTYDVSPYRNLTSLSVVDVNNMIANITK